MSPVANTCASSAHCSSPLAGARVLTGAWLAGAGILIALAALALTGCTTAQPNVIQVTSYKDPYFPEPHELTFMRCMYAQGRDRDRHIVAEQVEPAASADGKPIRRALHLQLFWTPRPGRTFADPSLVDATARYLVIGPAGVAVYNGTAFVYPRELRDGTLKCEIESGTLRLETIDGSPPPTIGDARLAGTLMATRDQNRATELRRRIELYAAGAYRERYTPQAEATAAP